MIKEFPKEREAKRKFLLDEVERIGPILQASGPKSEELGTLAPEAVAALARSRHVPLEAAGRRRRRRS